MVLILQKIGFCHLCMTGRAARRLSARRSDGQRVETLLRHIRSYRIETASSDRRENGPEEFGEQSLPRAQCGLAAPLAAAEGTTCFAFRLSSPTECYSCIISFYLITKIKLSHPEKATEEEYKGSFVRSLSKSSSNFPQS